MPTILTYNRIPLRKNEIARYAHCRYDAMKEQIDICAAEAEAAAANRICYEIYPLFFSEKDEIDLGFTTVFSENLKKCIWGCSEILVLAATVGAGIDRLIQKYNRISPAKAILLQAAGSEAVESLCDTFCSDIKKTYPDLRPRFSPGYGDLPLSIQPDLIRALDCTNRIGITLNDSLMMSPSKSVTAIIGIG